jgi:universal stress protein A
MQTYRRILVAIDLGKHSELVVRRAAQLAKAHDAKLIVAHIVDYTLGFESDHIPFRTPSEMQTAIADLARKRLDEMLKRLNLAAVDAIVINGRPEREIHYLVEQQRADMLVVGSDAPHGLRKIKDARLDARACQVLAVQPECRPILSRLHALLSHA